MGIFKLDNLGEFNWFLVYVPILDMQQFFLV